MFDVTFIIDFLISLALAIIIRYLLPYLRTKYNDEKISSAYQIIKILVQAVEQVTKVSGQGKKKKEQVIERFKSYNITMDEGKVSELIESAVCELNQNINKEEKQEN